MGGSTGWWGAGLVDSAAMKTFAMGMVCAVVLVAGGCRAQEVVPLYAGAAPGGPEGGRAERTYFSQEWHTQVVTNVTRPTLTVFRAKGGGKNGSAIVICPGGGFMALSISSEGTEVAQYLAARGMTAFVLKYRLAPTGEDGTAEFKKLWGEPAQFQAMLKDEEPRAVADGLAAVAYVKKHAAEYGVSPAKVGIVGFSAGGAVTAGVAYGYSAESRPAFVAPIYAGAFPHGTVPADAPPMFVAAATDDGLGLAPDSIALWQDWAGAHKSVELHVYAKGGHGFGMDRQGLPTDHWIDRFAEWLEMEGMLKAGKE